MEDICYKRTYLTAVIARVDFPSPLEGLDQQLPSEVSNAVLKAFPIEEPRQGFTQEVQVSDGGAVQQRRSAFTEWRFHGASREKTFSIAPMPKAAVFVECKQYSTYESFKADFLLGLEPFFRCYPNTQGSRVGLRYINEINLDDEEDPFDWDSYLHPKMLCLLDFWPSRSVISRVFHNLELNVGEFNLRYQFGMHNPDYPSPIIKKTWILDFDAYCQGPQEYAGISGSLDEFHQAIQRLFEHSITPKLREKMQ